MSVLVVAALVVATLLPGLGTYYLVPWGWLAETGRADVSDRAVRGTRLGMSVALAGTGTFVVSGFALLLGGLPTLVAAGVFLVATLLVVVGLLVPMVLLVAEAL